jgi:putative ABC transport system permease protein
VQRTRSILAAAAVAVGISVIVAVSSIADAVLRRATQRLATGGAGTLYVRRWNATDLACASGQIGCDVPHPPITEDDAVAIARLSFVASAALHVTFQADVEAGDRSLPNVAVDAYGSGWRLIGGSQIASGRPFSDAEARLGARLALVNRELSRQLTAENAPAGYVLRINGVAFRVIGSYRDGVLSARAVGSDAAVPGIVVPIAAVARLPNAPTGDAEIVIEPETGIDPQVVQAAVTGVLRRRRGLRAWMPPTFAILSTTSLMRSVTGLSGRLTLASVFVSGASLLAGAAGVISVCFISVAERTREIGLRRALGATRATVALQFLVESVAITSAGAVVGTVIAATSVLGIEGLAGLPLVLSARTMAAAIGVSAGAGVAFGMGPAVRAAHVDPAIALRHVA